MGFHPNLGRKPEEQTLFERPRIVYTGILSLLIHINFCLLHLATFSMIKSRYEPYAITQH